MAAKNKELYRTLSPEARRYLAGELQTLWQGKTKCHESDEVFQLCVVAEKGTQQDLDRVVEVMFQRGALSNSELDEKAVWAKKQAHA